MALILPRRIYLRKVGLEIFRYSIASSVVKTISFSIKDIELPPFVFNFMYLEQDICRQGKESVLSYNHPIFMPCIGFFRRFGSGSNSLTDDKLSELENCFQPLKGFHDSGTRR